MKCPHCGEDVPYENVKFCPNCGKTLVVKQKTGTTDLILVTAILTIMSAAFCAGLGCVGIERYLFWTSNGYVDLTIGFVGGGILSIVGAVFGILAGRFMLKRENVNFAMLGIILLLVSVFGDFILFNIFLYGYAQYGFAEISIFTEIVIFIFTILSALFLTKTKAEFV